MSKAASGRPDAFPPAARSASSPRGAASIPVSRTAKNSAASKTKTVHQTAKRSNLAAAAKTRSQANAAAVASLFATLDEPTRADCEQLDAWMRAATGANGMLYGAAIVGYGTTVVSYANGREAPWFTLGFSPRKQALVLYGVMPGVTDELLEKLGKHETGKGCLYVKRLADVDAETLQQILRGAATNKPPAKS